MKYLIILLNFLLLSLFISSNNNKTISINELINSIEDNFNKVEKEINQFYYQTQETKDITLQKLETEVKYLIKVLNGGGSLGCLACKKGLNTLKKANKSKILKNILINTILNLCLNKGEPYHVCKGTIDIYAPAIFEVIKWIDLDWKQADMRQLFCFCLDDKCPYPKELKPKKLNLPAKKVNNNNNNNIYKDNENDDLLTILHISDLHIDPLYKEGSEAACKAPICCQINSIPAGKQGKVVRKANKFGDFNCDTPWALFESMLKSIQNQIDKIDLVLISGDIPAHDVWNQSLSSSLKLEKETYLKLNQIFKEKNIKVVSTIGNHESVPANFFITTQLNNNQVNPYYEQLEQIWKDWIPFNQKDIFKNMGVYSIEALPGLKVISLNTNMCYILNFWLLASLQKDQQDPSNVLDWLIKELQHAEDNNLKVYIVGHMPPSHPDCLPYWSDQFHQIINRYYSIIKGMFFGHSHQDKFSIIYKSNSKKNSKTAINLSYYAPSLSTFKNLNPAFRIYKARKKDFEIYDTLTYITDITKVNNNLNNLPEWYLEYSARNYFSPKLNINETLTPSYWHKVMKDIEKKPYKLELFRWIMNRRNINQKCDENCQNIILCNLKASNSTEACSNGSPIRRH